MEISFYHILPFVVIGITVGFMGGFLGVGGGIIMIPLLTYWAFPTMNVSPEVIVHLAFGTSLAIIIPTSLAGSLAHIKNDNVLWRIVILLAIPGIIGSFLGSTLAAYLKGPLLQALFGVVLVITSLQMFLEQKISAETSNFSPSLPFPAIIIGFLVGVFSGFFGLGGGVIIIPLMVRFLKIPIHKAMGISIAFVFFASLVGTAGYIINGWGKSNLPPFALGYVHTLGWIMAGIPSLFLANWGVQLAYKTKPFRLRWIFAALVMLVGIRMLF